MPAPCETLPAVNREARTIPLLPKQIEFLQATEREVLYSGAFGAGKSRALCWRTVIRAAHPGAVEILTRKHNVTLKRTTLRTLLEPDGDLPPVLLPGTYRHNKSLQRITINGGGDIIYFGLDDPEKVGSTPATGANVDEATELTEADWTALRGRCRVKVEGLPNQLTGACNPGAPTHHLAKRFGLGGSNEAEPNCRAICTCSDDNFFLPADYIADLNTFTGVSYQRYVKGQWVAAEGLVWPTLLDCFVPHMEPPPGIAVGGVDFGFRNPFCALLGTIYEDASGRDILYIWWEHYFAGLDTEVHAAAMAGTEQGQNAEWYCDPEDPEAIRNLRKHDLSTHKAINRWLYGCDAVSGILAGGQVYISEACENLRKEAEVFSYPPGDSDKEKPVAKFDHAMSAFRYMVASAKKRGLIRFERSMDRGEIDDG